jgi:hypothetical protein
MVYFAHTHFKDHRVIMWVLSSRWKAVLYV